MKFWMMPDSGSNTRRDFEDFLKEFEEIHPEIEVNVEVFTRNTLWKNLFHLIFEPSSHELPDVVEIPHSWTHMLIKANFLEELSFFDPGLSLAKYLPPLIPHSYKKGTKDIYSVPWWMDITAMHYREDHLRKITKTPEEELSTWEGMLRICAKLKERFAASPNYFPLQNSDWRGSLSIRSVLPCIWSRGTDLFTADYASCRFREEEFVNALEDYIKLATHNYMPVLRERGSAGTMLSGKASIFISRRQSFNIFENKKKSFKIKTLPVPPPGKEEFSFISGINLAVPRASENKKDAMTFIKWLTAPRQQARYASLMEVFPALEDKFEDMVFAAGPGMATYAKIVSRARALQEHTVSAAATKILNEVLDGAAVAVVNGKYRREELERALDFAARQTDYLLDLYKE